jgi:hypothetical protein
MTAAFASGSRGRYWDDRYEQVGAEQVSWFQARPNVSLALIDTLRIDPSTPVIDVGGGSSSLVDELLARGSATSPSSTCPTPRSRSPGAASPSLTL